MQRWAILQVSRRHGVDNCAARHRGATACSPVPVCVSRRTFRSSRVTSNSSDSPTPPGEGDDDSTRRPSFSTPKFGNRWGGGQTQQPAGLSFAERAARGSLLEQQTKYLRQKEQQDRQQNAQSNPPEGSAAGARAWEFMNRQSYRRRNPPRFSQPRVRHEDRGHANTSPAASHGECSHGNGNHGPPARGLGYDYSQKSSHNPHLKWDCPNCQFLCYGEYVTCPKCATTRPGASGIPNEDWRCPVCQKHCLGNCIACTRCHTPRPGVDTSSLRETSERPLHSSLKWRCTNCLYQGFPEHLTCPKCKATRPGGDDISKEDWRCPGCQLHCFGRAIICRRCETPKPGVDIDKLVKESKRPPHSELKWDCPNCQFTCYGKYLACPICKTTRPGGGDISKEDWICPVCQGMTYGKFIICAHCRTPKPGLDVDSLREAADHGAGCPVHSKMDNGMKPSQTVPIGRSSPADLGIRADLAAGQQRAKEPDAMNPDAKEDQPIARRRFTGVQTWKSPKYERRPDGSGSGEMLSAGERSEAARLKEQRRYQTQELDAYGQIRKSGAEDTGAQAGHLESGVEESQYSEKRDEYRARRRQRERVANQQSEEPSVEVDQPRRKGPKYRENRRQRASDEDDDFDREEYHRRRDERRRQKEERAMEKERMKQAAQESSPLYLPSFISVSNLADVIGVRHVQFVRRMEDMGFEDVTYNHILDAETAGLVAAEFNFEPIFDTHDDDLVAAPEPEDTSALPTRPPVVTIMGHVDHGKTTILDWLRKSSVAASEHGGITQHIGAFSVSMPSGKMITFLDTPGHEAFLDMRRRGADVTDIVVLVVAADDSVKPQTVEAIKHATSSKVPVIVAMSKIDKPGVNGEKVKQDLAVHGINVEDYGGDVQAIGVSGKTGEGMVELEEAIITLSEVLDHRADATGNVEGWVIEASTKSHGRVATVLIKRGTLRQGDIVVAGTSWARVRTLRNEAGVSVAEASPGTPVEIDGWKEQPTAGAEVLQATDEQSAKDVIEKRLEKSETAKLGEDTMAMNQQRHAVLEKRRQKDAGMASEEVDQDQSGPKKINFIIKADVGGSAEAVMNSVAAVGNNEVYANVLRSSVGQVTESDIEHAISANGHIVSFNMPVDPNIGRMAENEGVNIMNHNVIYKLIDGVKDVLSEHLAPSVSHRVTGEAEISQIFEINVKRRVMMAIAGCKVRNGVISTAKKVRVLRRQEIIYDGTLSSLKNVKKDVTEMRKDTECGMGFADWAEFQPGDHVQCYEEIHEKRHL